MKLYGMPGWGSAITEFQLVYYGLDYSFEETGDLFASQEARTALEKINPLAQIPTLLLDDGTVMSESAAITLYLADITGRDDLVPGPSTRERAAFLRWLVYIVANIYPTYTYADDPARFVTVEGAQAPFADTVNAYARKLYSQLEDAAGAPWFLGSRFSALDIYIGVMSHWRPGAEWFQTKAPKLHAIAGGVKAIPELTHVWTRNYPEK